MLKEHNCVITNTTSYRREKCKGKFALMQVIQVYGGVEVKVH